MNTMPWTVRRRLLAAMAMAALLTGLAACVQMPTETQQVADLRPQITFEFDPANAALAAARVSVDGLETGALGDFAKGRATLRVLPGNHAVRVTQAGQLLLDEKVYLGDGVTRSFIVK